MKAYCNGHVIERHCSRGSRWWTVDGGIRRFQSMVEAIRFARSIP